MEIAKAEIDADIDIVVLPGIKPEIVIGGRNRVRIATVVIVIHRFFEKSLLPHYHK
jgi:hypothetical protein